MSFGTGDTPPPPPPPPANCSNYREIVSFVQKSWSVLLASDTQVTVYKDSPKYSTKN